MSDTEIAQAERKSLSAMFELFAISRALDAGVTGNDKLMAAAESINKIAATLDAVSDADLVTLSSVNRTSEGLLGRLIAERLAAIGFALPLYTDAAEFFAPVLRKVDDILRTAREHQTRKHRLH
jgi:hypothetical protein